MGVTNHILIRFKAWATGGNRGLVLEIQQNKTKQANKTRG